MLGLPTSAGLPTDITKFKEFERKVLERESPNSEIVTPPKQIQVELNASSPCLLVNDHPAAEQLKDLSQQADDSLLLLQDLFEQTYNSLMQKSTNPQNGQAESSTLSANDVKTAFFELRNKVSSVVTGEHRQHESVNQELQDLKHKHAVLQAEFQSKFEKDKTISLPIPNKHSARLLVRQDSNDSANSFVPLEGETVADYRLREAERKAEKLRNALTEGNKADSDSEDEDGHIPGIDEPLNEAQTKPAAVAVNIIPPVSVKERDQPHHHAHEHGHGHGHEHHHHQTGQKSFCACRRRGDHTHQHLYMDTHQMHYGL